MENEYATTCLDRCELAREALKSGAHPFNCKLGVCHLRRHIDFQKQKVAISDSTAKETCRHIVIGAINQVVFCMDCNKTLTDTEITGKTYEHNREHNLYVEVKTPEINEMV